MNKKERKAIKQALNHINAAWPQASQAGQMELALANQLLTAAVGGTL